jgi:hypothetical protein
MDIEILHDSIRAAALATNGVQSFAFGWPSDRTRGADPQSGDAQSFPRVFMSVPTMVQDSIRRQRTYNVTLYFDDLQGYNNDGSADASTQLEQWAALEGMASAFKTAWDALNLSNAADYAAITGNLSTTYDSFASAQRLCSVILTFTVITKGSC